MNYLSFLTALRRLFAYTGTQLFLTSQFTSIWYSVHLFSFYFPPGAYHIIHTYQHHIIFASGCFDTQESLPSSSLTTFFVSFLLFMAGEYYIPACLISCSFFCDFKVWIHTSSTLWRISPLFSSSSIFR